MSRPSRLTRPARLGRGGAVVLTVGTAAAAVLGAVPTSAVPTDSGSSTAAAVRHRDATVSASCRDGAHVRWKVTVDFDGSYRSGRTSKVRVSELRWTTGHRGPITAKVAVAVTDGNAHAAGVSTKTVRADYRGGRSSRALNPIDPVAHDAPAVLSVTIGTRGAAKCRVRFTEPISKPKPKPTPSPTSSPTPSPTSSPTSSPSTSATSTPSPTSSAPTSAADIYRADVFTDTNLERDKAALSRFGSNACVVRYAQAQAGRMAAEQRMYHQELRPILSSCGLHRVGENVAYGYRSGSAVVVGWMNSPGHRANILTPQFTLLGVGAAQGADGRWYAAQVFGG